MPVMSCAFFSMGIRGRTKRLNVSSSARRAAICVMWLCRPEKETEEKGELAEEASRKKKRGGGGGSGGGGGREREGIYREGWRETEMERRKRKRWDIERGVERKREREGWG